MAATRPDYPIICGRRNCAVCGRWRHTVDFKWRWSVPNSKIGKPQIEAVCAACRRQAERKRYSKLTDDEKVARGKKINKQKRERRRLEQAQIEVAITQQATSKLAAGTVDFVPFRMWLLLKSRVNGNKPRVLSDRAHIHYEKMERWLQGYEWRDGSYCEPTPIRSIPLKDVENVTTRLGEPEAARALYPLSYD